MRSSEPLWQVFQDVSSGGPTTGKGTFQVMRVDDSRSHLYATVHPPLVSGWAYIIGGENRIHRGKPDDGRGSQRPLYIPMAVVRAVRSAVARSIRMDEDGPGIRDGHESY